MNSKMSPSLLQLKQGVFTFKIQLDQRYIHDYFSKLIEYCHLRENKVYNGKLLCQYHQIEEVSREQFLDTLNYCIILRFKATFSYFDIPLTGQLILFSVPPKSEQQEIQVVTNGAIYGIVTPIEMQQSIIEKKQFIKIAPDQENMSFCILMVDDVRFQEEGVVVVFLKQGTTDITQIALEKHFMAQY